jgi:hypothetical protein
MRTLVTVAALLLLASAACAPARAQTDKNAAIRSAVNEYVHREHGDKFDAHILCVRQNGDYASVNYTAGPPGDEIASTMILARNKGMSGAPWKSAIVTTSDFTHSTKFAAGGTSYAHIQSQLQKSSASSGSCFK